MNFLFSSYHYKISGIMGSFCTFNLQAFAAAAVRLYGLSAEQVNEAVNTLNGLILEDVSEGSVRIKTDNDDVGLYVVRGSIRND